MKKQTKKVKRKTDKQRYVLIDREYDLIEYFTGTLEDVKERLIKHFKDHYGDSSEDANCFNSIVDVYPADSRLEFTLKAQQTFVNLKEERKK